MKKHIDFFVSFNLLLNAKVLLIKHLSDKHDDN